MSRWRKVTRNVKHQQCQSCGLETDFLFKGYALKLFRLDPILRYDALLLGTVVRLVEAMVCQRCREENQPVKIEKPAVAPECNHCDCAPRYTCCHCGGGKVTR